MRLTKNLYFMLGLLLPFFAVAQKNYALDVGTKTYLYTAGGSKTTLGINIEKFKGEQFSLNYHLSAGVINSGLNGNTFTMHMPAGPLIGCLFAAAAIKGGASRGTGDLLLYCFLIPEGVTYYPVKNKDYQFGLTADLLGVNYTSEKNPLCSSRLSYQQNFGIVFKMNLKKDAYIAIRAGYQQDFYLRNTLRGVNGGIVIGFSD